MEVERIYADVVVFIGSSFYLLTYSSVLFDDLNRILFLWIWVFCLSAPCKQCPWKSERGSGTAGTGFRVLSGWELNPNPLEETPELLTTE